MPDGPTPSLYDKSADPDVWSNTAFGDRRLTWKEACEAERERNRRLSALAHVLSDLDRCAHGRHEGDVCSGESGCDGPSRGNPHMRTGVQAVRRLNERAKRQAQQARIRAMSAEYRQQRKSAS